MLDFTSALYLGLRHPSWSLRPWAQFTTGVPAALAPPPNAREIAQRVAVLQGCELGTFGTSTLHLFWDLFGMIAGQRVAIYLDGGAYPIARWGVERAAARGVAVRSFPHHDAEALWRQLGKSTLGQLRPVVVADGFCPGCGRSAPIGAYLDCVRAFGGRLILDDTQGLGIFGHSPRPGAPYGLGGGGMLPWSHRGGTDVLVVSSLAKALGVPMTVLSGGKTVVEDFDSRSETRMHCSPPSIPVVRAAEHALAVNREYGDTLRSRLAALVVRFRQRAEFAGLHFSGGLFPVQTLTPEPWLNAVSLYERLSRHGIRVVLHQPRNGHGARMSFLITARHLPQEIDFAVGALAEALQRENPRIPAGGERQ
jgi:8-amino-7-oxononanoate synthase